MQDEAEENVEDSGSQGMEEGGFTVEDEIWSSDDDPAEDGDVDPNEGDPGEGDPGEGDPDGGDPDGGNPDGGNPNGGDPDGGNPGGDPDGGGNGAPPPHQLLLCNRFRHPRYWTDTEMRKLIRIKKAQYNELCTFTLPATVGHTVLSHQSRVFLFMYRMAHKTSIYHLGVLF